MRKVKRSSSNDGNMCNGDKIISQLIFIFFIGLDELGNEREEETKKKGGRTSVCGAILTWRCCAHVVGVVSIVSILDRR